MGMNAYGGMLTVLTGIDSVKPIKPQRVHRVVTILVLAVAWFVIAEAISAGAVATLFTALTLMLYLLVPWTATNLVDFFFVRRGHYAITELFNPNGIYGKWGARGLIAYAVGFAFEIPFMVLLEIWEYTGPLAPLERHRHRVDRGPGRVRLAPTGSCAARSTSSASVRLRRPPTASSSAPPHEGARPRSASGGPLTPTELTLPEPVGNQVRVRLTASGVCHSDLHARDGHWTVPLPSCSATRARASSRPSGRRSRTSSRGDQRGAVLVRAVPPLYELRRRTSAWLCTGHASPRASPGDQRTCTPTSGVGAVRRGRCPHPRVAPRCPSIRPMPPPSPRSWAAPWPPT